MMELADIRGQYEAHDNKEVSNRDAGDQKRLTIRKNFL